jgi:hypothetical protein
VVARQERAQVGEAAAVRQLEVELSGAERVAGAGEGEQADVHAGMLQARRRTMLAAPPGTGS